MRIQSIALLSLCLVSSPVMAAPTRCIVRTIQNVGAEEEPASVMTKGTAFGPVTSVRVNRNTGGMTFCEHGGFCYNASSFEFVSACSIGHRVYESEDSFSFEER